jgi:hypothetical protein
MVDPRTAAFFVSWQDDALLEDDLRVSAESAIAWGRERADFVLIRLGHGAGTYFSAGVRDPPVDDESPEPQWPAPRWPPAAEPEEGWWNPPGKPTPADVNRVDEELQRGGISPADAQAWAEERLSLITADSDFEPDRATLLTLIELLETSKRHRSAE